jgi:ATP-dependent DNA helicase HFM1/MER3
LNRRPPFGHEIIDCVNEFPEYFLKVTELKVKSNGGLDPVEVNFSVACGLATEPSKPKPKKQKGRNYNMTDVLTLTSDLEFIDFRRISCVADLHL